MTCEHRPKGSSVMLEQGCWLLVGPRLPFARRFPALRKKLEELVGDVASEKYEAAKDSVALFLDAQRHPFAQDLLVSEEPTPRPSFRPQSRPTSSNDAFEGQVDFVARQIDRYFGIFATRVI